MIAEFLDELDLRPSVATPICIRSRINHSEDLSIQTLHRKSSPKEKLVLVRIKNPRGIRILGE